MHVVRVVVSALSLTLVPLLGQITVTANIPPPTTATVYVLYSAIKLCQSEVS